jgi:bacillithiol synthase
MNLKSIKVQKKIYYYNDLFYDYLFHFEKLSSFFDYDYRQMESYRKRMQKVAGSYDKGLRQNIADRLMEYNRKIGCSTKTLENIEKIKGKKSAVVIGGQQPGLLTGPIFLIYKIITIIKTAAFLQEKLNVDVVPMFWNASDDSDFSQIEQFTLLSEGLHTYSLQEVDRYRGFMFAKIPLMETEWKGIMRFIKRCLRESDFKEEIIDLIEKCFKDDHKMTIPFFFAKICSSLFSKYGLIIIDPNHSGIKEFSSKIIKTEMENSKQISRSVNQEGLRLKEKGYHAQLKAIDKNLNIFYNNNHGRSKIFIEEDKYRIGKEVFKKTDIWDAVLKNKTEISLNVILRPMFQDSILPVLCTVCGPSEVSYFAQLKDAYRFFNMELPIIYPRFIATLAEKKVRKTMDDIGLDYEMLDMDKDKHANEAVKKKIDHDIHASTSHLRADLNARLKEFEKELLKNYNTIGSSFDRIKRNLNKEVDILEKKVLSEQKKKNKHIIEATDKIFLNLFPKDMMQERTINIFSYINKYSFSMLDDIIEQYEPFDFYHKMIEFV